MVHRTVKLLCFWFSRTRFIIIGSVGRFQTDYFIRLGVKGDAIRVHLRVPYDRSARFGRNFAFFGARRAIRLSQRVLLAFPSTVVRKKRPGTYDVRWLYTRTFRRRVLGANQYHTRTRCGLGRSELPVGTLGSGAIGAVQVDFSENKPFRRAYSTTERVFTTVGVGGVGRVRVIVYATFDLGNEFRTCRFSHGEYNPICTALCISFSRIKY